MFLKTSTCFVVWSVINNQLGKYSCKIKAKTPQRKKNANKLRSHKINKTSVCCKLNKFLLKKKQQRSFKIKQSEVN